MKQIQFSVLVLIAAILPGSHSVCGQAINATMQNAPTRVTTTRGAPHVAARPVASAPVAPQVVARPTGFSPQRFSPYVPRTIAQPPSNLPNHSPLVRTLNPTVASVMAQQGGSAPQSITIDPTTRQTELRTLAEMHERRSLGTVQPNTLDQATQETELRTLSAMHERRGIARQNQTLATIDPQRHVKPRDSAMRPQPEPRESLKGAHDKKGHDKKDHIAFDEAFRRHWHEWHNRNWWHDHCDTIVFVTTGYYFLDGSYWYPAFGYDPLNSYYDYDGPIYTYGDLLPDEVIANVQTALQDAGYYYGQITGSLGVDTRAALANFQRDYGLAITGAIDEATIEALGLY
jgi:Putative peptidoglycan binding domain